MMGRIFTKTLRYFGFWKPKSRNHGSGIRVMSLAEYESINPLPDAQVAHFLEYLKRETEFHPTLLAYISPPVDPLNAEEEQEETISGVCRFINLYLSKNGLHTKGPNLRVLGQLQRAAGNWAIENLSNADGAPR